ncbi:MAG: phosphoribosylaminoimidazole synthetase [Bacteriovoracaceae bacterium]
MFDKLPISAFVSRPTAPEPDMTLNNLQFWNCMDYGVTAICKQFIGSMDFEVLTRDYGVQKGTYIATLDNYHIDVNTIDYSTAETPDEHKSFNLLQLNNGQFCLYPNNRMRVYDNSLTPHEPKMPDFKVSTIEYQVENGNNPRLGDTDEYFWKTKQEK